jgi:hypothetical protein
MSDDVSLHNSALTATSDVISIATATTTLSSTINNSQLPLKLFILIVDNNNS